MISCGLSRALWKVLHDVFNICPALHKQSFKRNVHISGISLHMLIPTISWTFVENIFSGNAMGKPPY